MPSLLIWNSTTKEILTCLPAATNNGFDFENTVRGHGKDPADYEYRIIDEPITTRQFKKERFINAANQMTKVTELLPQIVEGVGLSTVTFTTDADLVINVDGTDYTVSPDSTGEAVLELESPIPAMFVLRANQRTYRINPLKVNVL